MLNRDLMNNNDLLKSHELLDEVGRIAKIGGWEMDLITRRAKWTKGTYDIVEIDYDNPVPGPDEHVSFYLPEDRPIIVESMRRLIEDDITLDFEARLKTAKGKIKWVRALGKAVRENGKCIRVYGTFQDITDQKKAEEALHVSEDLFRHTFEQVAVGLSILTPKGEWLQVNQRLCDIVGYSREELKKINFRDITHPDHLQQDLHHVRQMVDGLKSADSWEKRYIRKDKKVIWVRITTALSRSADGRSKYFITVTEDITAHKKAEIALVESEAKFTNIFNSAADGIVYLDNSGNVIEANKMLTILTGIAREELIGKNAASLAKKFLTVKDIPRVLGSIKHFLSGNSVDHFELGFNNRVLEISIPREPGSIGITAVFRDITERKQVEEKIRLQSEIMANMLEAVYLIRAKDNLIVYTNPEFERMFGYAPEEMLGKHVSIVNAPTDLSPEETAQKIITSLKKNGIWEGEVRNIKKDGTPFWCFARVTIFDHPSFGKVLLSVHTDITERKKIFEELQKRNEYIESILNKMPIGFALNTIDNGNVKYMNTRFEEIYGWSRDVLSNVSIFFDKVFSDPDYRKKMKSQIIVDMQSGDPDRMVWDDLKIVASTGEERYVTAINIPIIDQNLMISTVQNTTTRKRAEEELKAYREHLEELVKERTKELAEKNLELERFNKLFVGREFRINELKQKIKALEERLIPVSVPETSAKKADQ